MWLILIVILHIKNTVFACYNEINVVGITEMGLYEQTPIVRLFKIECVGIKSEGFIFSSAFFIVYLSRK